MKTHAQIQAIAHAASNLTNAINKNTAAIERAAGARHQQNDALVSALGKLAESITKLSPRKAGGV